MSKSIIAFFGASNGCGNFALKEALNAGHTCIALLRTPAKLADLAIAYPNLIIKEGNAHDAAAVAACLTIPGDNTRFVDAVHFSIGAFMDPKTFKFADPDVCKKGISAILEALTNLRMNNGTVGSPLLAVVSTTGITEKKRDFPLAFYPLYHWMLATPHADKKVMEERLRGSCERYVLVRPSLLIDNDKEDAKIREGLQDVGTGVVEKEEVGYVISRGAVGRWMYRNLLSVEQSAVRKWEGKAVSITW
ncbi:hypothetical protein V2G26_002042 [Clonostachys chloroleuca]|uniref:NAD(P)-binding domain-containing protein n=1 Tax=Clonostachys chloroleuca TaxID=1926264 RepID=A0AA35QB88_9HYPO|nr:unnamed protein product [Clonostachys chloroleuca]